jgi:hypothetical protein
MRERAEGMLTFAAVAALAVAGWNVQRGATRIGALVAGAGLLAVVTRVAVDADLRGPALRGTRQHGPAVAIAGLLVLASVSGYAPGTLSSTGTASAATVHESVVGGDSPKFMHADTGDMSGGQYDVMVYAPRSEIPEESGTGWRLIYEETGISTSNDKDALLFGNYGAYSEVKIRIEAESAVSGSPTFGTGRPGFSTQRNIGYTGGDADLKCSFEESFGASLFGSVDNVDCKTPNDATSINVTETDANETKVDLHREGLTLGAQSERGQVTRQNYLKDSKTVARIIGKNAYIRALHNSSTESVARQKARTAVLDYYSRHQMAILERREATMVGWQAIYNRADNETGVSRVEYVRADINTNASSTYIRPSYKGSNGLTERTVTLANGSTYTYTSVTTSQRRSSANYSWTLHSDYIDTSTSAGRVYAHNITRFNLTVEPPQDNYKTATVMNVTRTMENYNTTTRYADEVSAEVDTFANETYEAWQSGKINISDLVDPYLGAREYGTTNESFQSWALRSTQALGVAGPETLESTGKMTVTVDGATYEGIVLSDGLPSSGAFEVGNTYDPANLSGPQFIVTDSQITELSEPFTLDSATTSSGESVTSIQYRNITYQTQTLDGYKQLMQNLSTVAAEIEAREQDALVGGGGGSGGGGMPQIWGYPAWLIGLGGVAVLVVVGNLTRA